MIQVVTRIRLPQGKGEARERSLRDFAIMILEYQAQASQKMTSRGWCYFLEDYNILDKGMFDRVERSINECRKKGFLPIDFVAHDPGRVWQNVETPDTDNPESLLRRFIEAALKAEEYYTPDWWEGEEHYIQVMVEKIDLVEMFGPLCAKYHIPIVNAGGWYDILERAQAAFRFKQAEEKGLKPILLYFGDFDPYGLAISKFIHHNFQEIARGTDWDPENLTVDRFGLNFDFIQEHKLTWIDNLISGSKKDMSKQQTPIVQEYIKLYGVRKCEANAVIRTSVRDFALQLCTDTIEKYLGPDALQRFQEKRDKVHARLQAFRESTGLGSAIREALRRFDATKD